MLTDARTAEVTLSDRRGPHARRWRGVHALLQAWELEEVGAIAARLGLAFVENVGAVRELPRRELFERREWVDELRRVASRCAPNHSAA